MYFLFQTKKDLTLVYYSSILTRNVMICCKPKQLKLLLIAAASHKSYLCVVLSVPLLAGRYKFVQVIGEGQSSILVAAEVRK